MDHVHQGATPQWTPGPSGKDEVVLAGEHACLHARADVILRPPMSTHRPSCRALVHDYVHFPHFGKRLPETDNMLGIKSTNHFPIARKVKASFPLDTHR